MIAMGVVCLMELALHLAPDEKLLGYGAGLGSYYDVAHTIQDVGAPDIAILGTSRGRESIVQPWLKGHLEQNLGREVRVANFSCAGSHADEMLAISRLMAAAASKPKLVVYFLSPTVLKADPPNLDRLSILGEFPDRFAGRTGQAVAQKIDKPLWELRRWLDNNYLTFRHRYRFRHLMTSLIRRRQPLSAVQGDHTMWQLFAANRSLVTHPVSEQRIQGYIQRLLNDDGQYEIGPHNREALEETIRLFKDQGIPLIVMPAAMSPDLEALMPHQVLATFGGALDQVVAQSGVRYLTYPEIGVELDRSNFREQSHLNLSGARKITEALAGQIIIPLFEQPSAP